MNFNGPWRIDGGFDADITVSIVDQDDFEVVEVTPSGIEDDWTPAEIARVHAIRAVPELLDALRAIRKIGYDSQETRTREALLKCIDIAETAISAAESTTTLRSARAPQPKKEPK